MLAGHALATPRCTRGGPRGKNHFPCRNTGGRGAGGRAFAKSMMSGSAPSKCWWPHHFPVRATPDCTCTIRHPTPPPSLTAPVVARRVLCRFHMVPDLLKADKPQARIRYRPPARLVRIAPRQSDHGMICRPCAGCRHPRHDVRDALVLKTDQEGTAFDAVSGSQLPAEVLGPLAFQRTDALRRLDAAHSRCEAVCRQLSRQLPGKLCMWVGRVGVGWRGEGKGGRGDGEGIADGGAPRQRS